MVIWPLAHISWCNLVSECVSGLLEASWLRHPMSLLLLRLTVWRQILGVVDSLQVSEQCQDNADVVYSWGQC